MGTVSLLEVTNILSIIDNFSIRVYIYLMKDKLETLTKFKNWKVHMENQIDKKMKYLRTDNGLKFSNSNFDNFYNDCGITIYKTMPYTLQ